ncbi:hypothetical protein AAF712_011304 [Marasmius tenuissimus]|uniref:Malate dehydrogenase n=1 Tax=Marasmius tenuissimus TaxID=585030 RepID=A0ABR2ZJN9_9AGAR
MLKLLLLSLAVFALGSPATGLVGRACDVSNVKIPAGSLPAQTAPTTHIAFGRGTQNYTCSSAGTYATAGAVANLFDASCNHPKTASDSPSGSGYGQLIGQHYFITNPVNASAGISPKWDFTSFYNNPKAFVVGQRAANISAPSNPTVNVDWLKLTAIQGTFASEIYRTHTSGGQPPSSCTPGSGPITVPYSSYYWFTGGSF